MKINPRDIPLILTGVGILGFGASIIYGMYKPKETVKNRAEIIYTSPVFLEKNLNSVIEDLSKIKKSVDSLQNI